MLTRPGDRGTVESDSAHGWVYLYGFDGQMTPTQARALAADLTVAADDAEAEK